MPNTACSKCAIPCKFQDHDFWNCYLREIDVLQNSMTKEDINLFQQMKKRVVELYEQTDNDSFQDIRNGIDMILETYDEEL